MKRTTDASPRGRRNQEKPSRDNGTGASTPPPDVDRNETCWVRGPRGTFSPALLDFPESLCG